MSADSYAESVIGILREHFEDLADPVVAAALTVAIRQQVDSPAIAAETCALHNARLAAKLAKHPPA